MIQILRQRSAHILLLVALISSVCIPLMTSTPAYAAQTQSTHPAQSHKHTSSTSHARSQAASGHATILVLDMSGSMGTNDPNGYRCSAAKSYIDLSSTNDYIGLVGLDANGETTNDGFPAAQAWTTQPLPTQTVQDKQNLRQLIDTSSHNCKPDSNTPTYDALNIAYGQLDKMASISKQPVSGSVILLTDGAPCPDVDNQINAINTTLTKKFLQRGWPIDVIGLGQDTRINDPSTGCAGNSSGTFHDFLKGIAGATGGNFYDDSHGPVQGVSALNIAPFFALIFSKYTTKAAHEDIPPTQLNGETQKSNFTVVDGTSELDVLVVRSNPNIQVHLLDPQSQLIDPNGAGVFFSDSGNSVVYKIVNLTSFGPWILNVSGSGEYIMYDFQQTNIGLVVDSVQFQGADGTIIADPKPLPLGQDLTVNAHVTASGQTLNDGKYTVKGYVSYNAMSNDCTQAATQSLLSITMNYQSGSYSGKFNVQDTNPAGTYNILLCASYQSAQNVYASTTRSVRIELFPAPYFVTPSASTPVNVTTSTTVIRWPWLLQLLYGLPVVTWLSNWGLQGTSAQPQTHNLNVVLQAHGQPYTGASIQPTAKVSYVSGGQKKSLTANIVNQGKGYYAVQFVPPLSGAYAITFETSGSYKDSHGEFGPTLRTLTVTLKDAPADWVLNAWKWLGFFGLFLLFLICLVHFFWTPRPYGTWTLDGGGNTATPHLFSHASHSNPLAWFFRRNILTSRSAKMPPGLLFRFRRGGNIEVRPRGVRSNAWKSSNGSALSSRFQRASKLIYVQGQTVDPATGNATTTSQRYTISPNTSRQPPGRRPTTRGGGPTHRNRPTPRRGKQPTLRRPTSPRNGRGR